jgi:hypothetical protein
MADHLKILRKVGTVLIAVGLADIGVMVYCIANGQSYSSSFNIFAVIGGIFLCRGSLAAVRLITWFAAFMLAGFCGAVLLVFPFLKPAELWGLEFKLNPVTTSVSAALAVAVVALLFWIVRSLRSAAVIEALSASGRTARPPTLAFGLGIALAIFMSVMLNWTLNGERGAKAVALARETYGSQYKYHPTAMQWSGTHTSATLDAYSDHEIKSVSVEWSE